MGNESETVHPAERESRDVSISDAASFSQHLGAAAHHAWRASGKLHDMGLGGTQQAQRLSALGDELEAMGRQVAARLLF